MSNRLQTRLHSPHWVDTVVDRILIWQKSHQIDKLHIDDMKTPSGRVHTGALRGVLIHDLVAQALQKKVFPVQVINTYVFNDMDPMDGLPAYLNPQEYQQQMGKPLYHIPAPPLDQSGIDFSQATAQQKRVYQQAKSFAEFYALDFIEAFRKLGCTQKIIWSHELYESGQMDKVIQESLDNVDKFRQIYKEIADYQLPKNWFPFQVICPKCGKVGTTLVTDWNGKEVSFECQENKVTWAKGCGYQGKISPFGGKGKLYWKVDWPAHWKAIGVTIEGAGKDHSSAGGSRDMANAFVKKIFHIPTLFDIPYEWILIRGAKMSSSKGVGTSAREFVELFPPAIGRFLFVSNHYSQVIDFDPVTMSIPDLFDAYDEAAQIYWGVIDGDQRLARSFELSQIASDSPSKEKNQAKILIPKKHFLPRFRDLAMWMQYPEINLVKKFEEIKGAKLNQQELIELADRQKYAEIWINRYASDDYRFQLTREIPEKAKNLTNEEKEYLKQIVQLIEAKKWRSKEQELQQELYQTAKNMKLNPRKAFAAIYLALLGKNNGPRAAWLLLSIDFKLLKKRVNSINNL